MAIHNVVVDVSDERWPDGTTRKMTVQPDGLQHLPDEDKRMLVQMFALAIQAPLDVPV